MKKIFLVLLLGLSMASFAQNIKKVAILEVVDKEGVIPYAIKYQVRTNLTFAINRAAEYEGLDRVDMDQIMGEYTFQHTGMVNDHQIKELGKMTGAQYILIAEVVRYNENYIIDAKMLDVETGGVFNSAPPATATKDPEQMQAACIKVANTLLNLPTRNTHTQASLQREQEEKAAIERAHKQKEAVAIAKANNMGSLFGKNDDSGRNKIDVEQKGNPVGPGSKGGNSWSLSGRGIRGTLPLPANNFNQAGKVVVQIRVNAAGKVVSASVIGGDVDDRQTQQLALEAARKATFTEGDHEQIGTITYIFKLN